MGRLYESLSTRDIIDNDSTVSLSSKFEALCLTLPIVAALCLRVKRLC
jgi:hypothetical protein